MYTSPLDVIKMSVLLLQQNTLLLTICIGLIGKNTKVSSKDLIYTGFSSIIESTRADIKETIPFICKEEL